MLTENVIQLQYIPNKSKFVIPVYLYIKDILKKLGYYWTDCHGRLQIFMIMNES